MLVFSSPRSAASRSSFTPCWPLLAIGLGSIAAAYAYTEGPYPLAVALLSINNLRDAKNDVRSGKRTMAVRFGETFAWVEIAFCVLMPFAIVATVAAVRSRPWLMTTWIALPLVVALLVRVYRQ